MHPLFHKDLLRLLLFLLRFLFLVWDFLNDGFIVIVIGFRRLRFRIAVVRGRRLLVFNRNFVFILMEEINRERC